MWDKAREVYEDCGRKLSREPEVAHRLGVVADAQRRHSRGRSLFLLPWSASRETRPCWPTWATAISCRGSCQGGKRPAQGDHAGADAIRGTRNNLGLVVGHQGRHEEALSASASRLRGRRPIQPGLRLCRPGAGGEGEALLSGGPGRRPTAPRAREALSSFEEYDRLPQHLRDDGVTADDGVRVRARTSKARQIGGVQQASSGHRRAACHQLQRQPGRSRALHTESRGMLNRNMASQRARTIVSGQVSQSTHRARPWLC